MGHACTGQTHSHGGNGLNNTEKEVVIKVVAGANGVAQVQSMNIGPVGGAEQSISVS